MVRARTCRTWGIALAFGLLTGCSSGMKYKVDDGALDSVSSGERQSWFVAKNDAEIARADQRNADNQLEAADHERDAAKAEKKQAALEVEKAEIELEASIASQEENRHNAAEHGKSLADLGVKVADAKLAWLDQKRDWLKAVRAAAEAHQREAEARAELEKARLAKKHDIKPSEGPVDVGNFDGQWKDRNDEWQSAKKDAAAAEQKTKDREKAYQDLAAQYAKLKG
jgi:hypothetical protein